MYKGYVKVTTTDMTWAPEGKRKVGRPKVAWGPTVEGEETARMGRLGCS